MSSTFRKLAPAIWTPKQMGIIYAHVDLDIENIPHINELMVHKKKSPLPWILFVLFKAMNASEEICKIITMGRRLNKRDFSFTVVADRDSSDLRYFKIKPEDHWQLQDFEKELALQLQLMSENWDHHNGWSFKWIKKVPSIFLGLVFKLLSFALFDLKISGSLIGLDKHPFSPILVSNIGSLKLDQGYVPLVPFMRNMMSISLGRIHKKPVYNNENIEARWTLPISFTIDHRYMDGVHCHHILNNIRKAVKSFEADSSKTS